MSNLPRLGEAAAGMQCRISRTAIRAYRESDREVLLETWYLASKIAHAFLERDFFDAERRNIEMEYLPIADTRVFTVGDEAVGFISLIGNEVGGLFVHPEHQRKGIGRALMDYAASRRERLELQVFEENASGRNFYRKYGFVETGAAIHAGSRKKQIRMALEGRRA